MTKRGDRIEVLMINTLAGVGGAAGVAGDLARTFRSRGHRCQMMVGHSVRPIEGVTSVPSGHPTIQLAIDWAVRRLGKLPFTHRLRVYGEEMKQRLEWPETVAGGRDYVGPTGSWRILKEAPRRPDIVHAHNLHSGYFDLRALPAISAKAPVVMTLHDAWMLSGHCAHSFACTRWQTGCGECPDLSIQIALPFDRSAENWREKAAIYRKCQLRVATPSRWLMDKVEQSMLWPAIVDARVIPNGVDRSIFHPDDRDKERQKLGLPLDATILLFAANGIRQNIWKDYPTLDAAISRLRERTDRKVLFLALGEDGATQTLGATELRFLPAVPAGAAAAAHYRAADLYVHAARADNFPSVVIEALACGTPSVATAIGGIPEQIRSAGGPGADFSARTFSSDQATGVLTPPGNAQAMAEAIDHLCDDRSILFRLGANAARDAAMRFDLQQQADIYLEWFGDIRARRSRERWSSRLGLTRTMPVAVGQQ
jgi:glycosyltransferase involved in cell wall biosynthesis